MIRTISTNKHKCLNDEIFYHEYYYNFILHWKILSISESKKSKLYFESNTFRGVIEQTKRENERREKEHE
jgi:predicted membrane-bound dolichyl-phosphate-mannose-protein mannosyltransferase